MSRRPDMTTAQPINGTPGSFAVPQPVVGDCGCCAEGACTQCTGWTHGEPVCFHVNITYGHVTRVDNDNHVIICDLTDGAWTCDIDGTATVSPDGRLETAFAWNPPAGQEDTGPWLCEGAGGFHPAFIFAGFCFPPINGRHVQWVTGIHIRGSIVNACVYCNTDNIQDITPFTCDAFDAGTFTWNFNPSPIPFGTSCSCTCHTSGFITLSRGGCGGAPLAELASPPAPGTKPKGCGGCGRSQERFQKQAEEYRKRHPK